MRIVKKKIVDGISRDACIDNSGKCFLVFALAWSLAMAFLLGWGLWPELSGAHGRGLTESQVHFWRWAVSLGVIWLFVLFCTNLAIRKVASGVHALRRASRDLVTSEQECSRREVLFESIYNAITDAVVFTDKNRRIVMVNPAFVGLTGFSPSEVSGRPLDVLFAGSAAPSDSRIRSHLHLGVREMLCCRKDGFSVLTESFGSHVQNRDGENIGFLLVLRDISRCRAAAEERARIEGKLRQSCKMEALGTLAGGIAHDFNNILGIIFINTEVAMSMIDEKNPVRKNVERIETASRRARDLVQQILEYSRQPENTLAALMPGALVKESLQFLRAGAPAGIVVDHYVNDGFRSVMMDPSQVRELLVNLFSNAVQAVNGLGKIEVKATVITLEDDAVNHRPTIPAGTYFRVLVRDSGTGPAALEQVPDPFFSTREAGDDGGMGLVSAQGIVRNHGGFITVDSEPGAGTAVRVYFPVVEEEEGEAGENFEGLRGTEHVLFVDDEEMLVEMLCKFLRDQGFTVTEQTESRTALDLFKADPAAFDIIVTDQTMPGMTGSELAVEALRIRPDVPIILLSGHSRKISREEVLELGIMDFLHKPFDGKALVRTIRNVLDHDLS